MQFSFHFKGHLQCCLNFPVKDSLFFGHSFPVDEGGIVKSVVQYFQETYGFAIQHTYLPCLQVGNQQRPNYLPMEVKL